MKRYSARALSVQQGPTFQRSVNTCALFSVIKKLAGMTEADILSYLHDLDLKPATRNRHLALIKAVFTGLYAWDTPTALRRFISKRCLK